MDWTTIVPRIISSGSITATSIASKSRMTGVINGSFGNSSDYIVLFEHYDTQSYGNERTLQYISVYSQTTNSFTWEVFNDGAATNTSHWRYIVVKIN